MAADIQDWTQAVNVIGGTVAISGIATVTISGTPAVSISGTPSVTVSSGTISIGNTPSVTISGTPTVVLGGGTATIGSVDAINSTVTVAGTVSISGTTTIAGAVTITSGTVSISGTTTIAGAVTVSSGSITVSGTVSISGTTAISGAVTISSGTVSISGTTTITGSVTVSSGSITVSGTVSIGNTPSVTISGTPSVTIASGSVNIAGTSDINIVAQAVTVQVAMQQTNLGTLSLTGAGSTSATWSLPTGCHAVGIVVPKRLASLTVTGVTTGIVYRGSYVYTGLDSPFSIGFFVVPVASSQDTSVTVAATDASGSSQTLYGVAVLDVEAPLATPAPPAAWQAPNSTSGTIANTIANGATASIIVAGASTVAVYLFETYWNYDAAVAGSALLVEDSGGTIRGQVPTSTVGPHKVGWYGQMTAPRGLGVRLHNTTGSSITVRGQMIFSQSP